MLDVFSFTQSFRAFILIAGLFFLAASDYAQTFNCYIDNDYADTANKTYSFDIKILATSGSINFSEFQFGLYVNAAFLNGNAVTPSITSYDGSGNQGAIGFDATNNIIQIGVNTNPSGTACSASTTIGTSYTTVVYRITLTSSGTFNCNAAPAITFNFGNSTNSATNTTITSSSPWRTRISYCNGSFDTDITDSGTYNGSSYAGAITYGSGGASTNLYSGSTGPGMAVHVTASHCSGINLTLGLYIQGYMDPFNAGFMVPALANEGVGLSATDVDTVTVYVVDQDVSNDPNNPFVCLPCAYTGFWKKDVVASGTGLLQTDGALQVNIPGWGSGASGNYWVAVSQRGAITTWSSFLVNVSNQPALNGAHSNIYLDFRGDPTVAYNANEADNGDNTYSFYSGDWNQDENVSAEDFPQFDRDQSNFEDGYYPLYYGDGFTNTPLGVAVLTDDLNGDGNVDIFDYSVFNLNQIDFASSNHP